MAKTTPKPPALQVLFEPWAEGDTPIRWDAQEAFAGVYWIDALDADGRFVPRGFRAQVTGCTTCYRHADNSRVHWPDLNTFPDRKKMMKCPQWKRVEAIVKAFGGWKRTHYVELIEHEGLQWQPIPDRRQMCPGCGGAGFLRVGRFGERHDCETCKARKFVSLIGPIRPDRSGMSEVQQRMRRPEGV